jgi:hypothetical protein
LQGDLSRNSGEGNRLFFGIHLLYKGARKGEHVNRAPQRDRQFDDSQLIPATSKDTHRNGRPLLTLVPEYIPAEVSLENLGFFTPSSKRIKDIYVKEKVLGDKIGPDGVKRTIKAEISANHKLGLPITSDLDYYRAFLKICYEAADPQGRLYMPIIVPTAKLLRYAGKRESAKEWKEVQAWFERMTLTGIIGGIYRAKQKHYDEGFVETLFSRVVTRGGEMRNGEIAQTNHVWLAPWFLANYFHHHLRPIDLTFHQRLRKPIAKALYPLLETGWYASGGKPYAKRYRDLCAEFLLANRQHLSRIREQLDPAHQELAEERFLAKWEYRESADKTDYSIFYYPGKKFFEDQKAKEERRQKVEQIIKGQAHAAAHKEPIPDGQISPQESEARKAILVQDILEVTRDPRSAVFYAIVARKLDTQTIYRALSETKEALRNREIRTTPARYFTDLVKRYATERGINL